MKPEAPVEIRGTLQPIATVLPGLDVVEHFPEIARIADRLTVARSVTHPYPVHGVAFATTGVPAIDASMELAPHDSRHHPYFGSIVQYFDYRSRAGRPANVPQNVGLPFRFSSQRVGEVARAGPYAAFLGLPFNPTWTDFFRRGIAYGPEDAGDDEDRLQRPVPGLHSRQPFSILGDRSAARYHARPFESPPFSA